MIPLVYCPINSCRDRTAARATLSRELPSLALSICEVGAYTYCMSRRNYSLFHMTLHSFLSHITPINTGYFTTRVLTHRHLPYPLASNGLLRSAHQRWRPDTSLV